ncbi:MAG: helix-turn-helix domain-containing protein [Gammaproteobacteria bacterium]|nr:helix-turn-helix domain-containing protein [Gammaproteobacteria bacterium]
MAGSNITIGIMTYPGCMLSAVHGLKEMFTLANDISMRDDVSQQFTVELYSPERIKQSLKNNKGHNVTCLQVVIIPPSIEGKYYLNPDPSLVCWIQQHHAAGVMVCSVCAGAFILAATNLLTHREATTHWGLTAEFSKVFPEVRLDTNKILINDGDMITAGGLMSWTDLGLELVAQFTNANIMRQLGKALVIDTGLREQRFYQSFSPVLNHGDNKILKAQHFIQTNYGRPITIKGLSELSFLTDRTFLRRFVKATGFKPVQYIQRTRVQKACELLETTNATVDIISSKAGYEDAGAFRKNFVKITGLTPKGFRNRFASV